MHCMPALAAVTAQSAVSIVVTSIAALAHALPGSERLNAVERIQFIENVLNMEFHRIVTDGKDAGDLAIGLAFGDPFHHLCFTIC